MGLFAHVYGKTGALEAYAAQSHTGLMLGLEYATGGTMQIEGQDIVVIEKDTQLKPDIGRAALAEAFGDDDAQIAVGPVSSGVALAMLPVAEEYERILIVEPAVADSITGENWNRYIFRTGRNSSQDAISNAVALGGEGVTVATLAQDYAFGRDGVAAFRSALEGTGATVAHEEYVPTDTTDFTAAAERIFNAMKDIEGEKRLFIIWAGGGNPMSKINAMPPLLPTILRSLPALSLPIVILGGIVFGWMTPTEAAGVAVFVALLAGWFYDGLTRASVIEGLQRTAMLSGSIFIIICAVSALGHLGALERIPEAISGLVTTLGLGPVGYMLAINVIFIIAGMVLDIPVALALLVPLLAPVAIAQGADPVHLGILLCFNLCIGLISPPMGGCLLVVSAVTGVNYWKLAAAVVPFVLVEIAVLALLIAFPQISLALPQAFGLAGG